MNNILRKIYSQDGLVMPAVIALVVITIFLGITAAYVVNSQTIMGKRHSETETALQIAEAGVNRAIYLLNENPDFARNPDAVTSIEDFELGNVLPRGHFELELIAASSENPFFTIISTGIPNQNPDMSRTVQVEARKRSFTNYVYFSDNDGSNIWWVNGEQCFGPLHTNTVLNIRERPIFYDTVTYGVSLNKGTNYNPDFRYYEGYEPVKVEPLVLPPNNSSLALVAQAQHSGEHYYTGRTSIMLKDTVYDVHYWDETLGEYVFVQDVDLPPNGVIYVAGDVGTGYTTPNKFGNTMGNTFVSGILSGRLTIAAQNNIYITGKNPTIFDYEDAPPTPGGGIRYQNTTINLDNNTGDITVGGTGNDMLGLVANNNIFILCWGWFDHQYNPAVKATLKTGLSANDNAITWEAVEAGVSGNNISIEYVEPNPNTALSVSVTGSKITITLGTDSSGITTTASQVITAVNDHFQAGSLVKGSNTGDSSGNGLMHTLGITNLYGGLNAGGDYGTVLSQETQRANHPDVSENNVEIYGAIFAINGGFGYEPYNMTADGSHAFPVWLDMHRKGDPLGSGRIIIRGSLIQNTRRPVGYIPNNSGYNKDYAHDPRMRIDTPPNFLEPENAGWEIMSWRE